MQEIVPRKDDVWEGYDQVPAIPMRRGSMEHLLEGYKRLQYDQVPALPMRRRSMEQMTENAAMTAISPRKQKAALCA
jgi:hypothetical protein